MPRTRAALDRAALEEATLERLQAEARRYRLPIGGERGELIDRILSHIERLGAQDAVLETHSGPGSEQSAEPEMTDGAEEPLTAGTLRAALGEMTELMRQQQQSMQMLIQLMANQTGASPVALPVGAHTPVVVMEAGASPAPTERNSNSHIPGNSVSWLATQIPEFGGTDRDNVSTWVRRVDQVAGVHGATDGVTLLAASSKLVKTAKTWYEVQAGPAVESSQDRNVEDF